MAQPPPEQSLGRVTKVVVATSVMLTFISFWRAAAIVLNDLGSSAFYVGGIAELKWIAEYADLHGILVAPHGIFDGLIGLAAHVHMGAALPQNYIAFEYPLGQPDWWYEIVEGLPNPIVKRGFIDVWDRPGLGVTFNVQAAKSHLPAEDRQFFD